jgi:hypothetical protein
LSANLNSPTLHAQVADTRFSLTLITYLKGDVRRTDEEAIYIEHKGKDSGIVRFTFEMIEGLKIVEEAQSTDSKE